MSHGLGTGKSDRNPDSVITLIIGLLTVISVSGVALYIQMFHGQTTSNITTELGSNDTDPAVLEGLLSSKRSEAYDNYMIDYWINHCRQSGFTLHPPCSPEEVAQFEQNLAAELTDDLRKLYLDHNGAEEYTLESPFRLLSREEVLMYQEILVPEDPGAPPSVASNDWALRTFWTDDSSNYAAVYLNGPLRGQVVFWGVSFGSFLPRYQTMNHFLFLMEMTDDDYALTKPPLADYPQVIPTSKAADLAAARKLCDELKGWYVRSEDNGFDYRNNNAGYILACLATVTPLEDIGTLIPHLDNQDPSLVTEIISLFENRTLQDFQTDEERTSFTNKLKILAKDRNHNLSSKASHTLSILSGQN